MEVTKIETLQFNVPFKVVFRHASASRHQTQNIIVRITCSDGHIAYGEGCPRDYVTNETVETACIFIQKHTFGIIKNITSFETLSRWVQDQRKDIDENPAAFCALEIALLDAIGKCENKTLEQVLDLPELAESFVYSAVLGDSPLPLFAWQLFRYNRQKFRDYKIKLSGNLKRDQRKIMVLKAFLGASSRIRLDANNFWASADDCGNHIEQLTCPVFAIEEPLRVGDLAGCAKISKISNAAIILDESFLRLEQLDTLPSSGQWLINLRISKMGGIIRSLEVANAAADKGIGIIVGAQVGETSILTRAALTVASNIKDNLIASEGAFGTILLKHDLTSRCLMFGTAGVLDIGSHELEEKYGLGLQINPNLLSAPK